MLKGLALQIEGGSQPPKETKTETHIIRNERLGEDGVSLNGSLVTQRNTHWDGDRLNTRVLNVHGDDETGSDIIGPSLRSCVQFEDNSSVGGCVEQGPGHTLSLSLARSLRSLILDQERWLGAILIFVRPLIE